MQFANLNTDLEANFGSNALGYDPTMHEIAGSKRAACCGTLGGKGLVAGALVPIAPAPGAANRPHISHDLESRPIGKTMRFILGPQADYFSRAGIETFCTSEYRISESIDRMGYRLGGPVLCHPRGHDIVSDGIALGAIQIPRDGQPIVLMADRQLMGGYPKIGTVIRADIPSLPQARPW